MSTITLIIQIIVTVLCVLVFLLTIPLFRSFRWPAPIMWATKILVSALSPIFLLLGVFSTIVGLTTESLLIFFLGIGIVLMNAFHYVSVTRPPKDETGFKQAFGSAWKKSSRLRQKIYPILDRNAILLPSIPKPRLQRDIPFASVPGTNRWLNGDVWQPAESIKPSGLVFIYFHGSAYYFLDKDFCTRPFFSQLAAQGHVIMDVAYRLAPETDMLGMVHDIKRAIVWMKENADNFGIDKERIVIGGGSAGGHLALLAAYTSDDLNFAPPDLYQKDASVSGVISLYGQSDLEALYYHTNQHLTSRSISGKPKGAVPTKMPKWLIKAMGDNYHRLGFDKDLKDSGGMAALLGCHPNECPELYAEFSPVKHVHSDCPPTLLIHGKHDMMAPVSATYRLHQRLVEKHVPVVLHVLPQTDHGFDLVLPKISPSAHNAIRDVEIFLNNILTQGMVKKPEFGSLI